jgi:hypothetical protein
MWAQRDRFGRQRPQRHAQFWPVRDAKASKFGLLRPEPASHWASSEARAEPSEGSGVITTIGSLGRNRGVTVNGWASASAASWWLIGGGIARPMTSLSPAMVPIS